MSADADKPLMLLNPLTNRRVRADGVVGRRLLAAMATGQIQKLVPKKMANHKPKAKQQQGSKAATKAAKPKASVHAKKVLVWKQSSQIAKIVDDWDVSTACRDAAVLQDYEDFVQRNRRLLSGTKYIFVVTGYAQRVIQDPARAREFQRQYGAACVFTDQYWDESVRPLVLDQAAYEACKRLPANILKRGGVVYRRLEPLGRETRRVDTACSLDFCGFCEFAASTRVEWWDVPGHGIVCVMLLDTESG